MSSLSRLKGIGVVSESRFANPTVIQHWWKTENLEIEQQ